MIIAVAGGLVGACAGSYASTVAVRMARDEQASNGRSRCDGCGMALGFAATVPVISYVSRRGVCSACGARIDALHPVGEISGAIVASLPLAVVPGVRGALLAGLGLILVGSVLIDAKTRRLPDLLTLGVAMFAAALAFQEDAGTGLVTGLISGAATFALMELVRRSFLWMRRKPWLGFGDVKFAAALAIWLGVAMPWAMVAASILGLLAFLVVRPKDGRIAFGPALATGALAVGLLQEVRLWPLP